MTAREKENRRIATLLRDGDAIDAAIARAVREAVKGSSTPSRQKSTRTKRAAKPRPRSGNKSRTAKGSRR